MNWIQTPVRPSRPVTHTCMGGRFLFTFIRGFDLRTLPLLSMVTANSWPEPLNLQDWQGRGWTGSPGQGKPGQVGPQNPSLLSPLLTLHNSSPHPVSRIAPARSHPFTPAPPFLIIHPQVTPPFPPWMANPVVLQREPSLPGPLYTHTHTPERPISPPHPRMGALPIGETAGQTP